MWPSSVTCQLAIPAHLYLRVSNAVFLILCVPWYPSNLKATHHAGGPERACSPNAPKYIGILLHHSFHFPPQMLVSTEFILIVGPLPLSKGYSYLLTCIDRFTRWPEAIPIPNITAETVAEAFVANWVARFGIPSTITTDRGESVLWEHFMELLGTKRIRTTTYHPIANGLIERFHRQLKTALKCQSIPSNWVSALSLILLGIRTSLKGDLRCSAAELVYGTTFRLPGQFPRMRAHLIQLDILPNFVTPCSNCVLHPLAFQSRDGFM